MPIIRFVSSSFLLAAVTLAAGLASAQGYPNKTIRIIASEAGSAVDIYSRIIAQGISPSLGQPVIVENRPSALTGEIVSRATADGYTLGIGGSGLWLTQLTRKTSFDPFKDLSPVTSVVTYPSVLVVHPSLPAKSVKELIELAKAKPGALNYAGSVDPGAPTFLYPELLKAMANVNIVRIPYNGSASGLVAVMAGEAQMMIINPGSAMPNVKSGKLRALGITSLQPSPLVPGIPTIASTGLPGYEAISISGAVVPAGTPAAVITRLNQEMVRVLSRADTKEKLYGIGLEAAPSTPAQFAAIMKADIAKWGKLIKEAGIKAD